MAVNRFLRDLEGLFNYSTDENPTTQQDYQEAVKNWVQTIESIVDCTLWQPETTYQAGDTVRTPSLSKQALLLCITAGQSGAAEPDYTDVSSNDEITDGTVVWLVQTVTSQEKAETYTDVKVSAAVPTGCVQAFAGSTSPDGWLLCDGSAVSRTDYAALYAVIGTTYGVGDGTSTFNLPDLIDKFVQGNAVSGTEHSAGLPNIEGALGNVPGYSLQGAFTKVDDYLGLPTGGYFYISNLKFSAANGEVHNGSYSNLIYGKSDTVQPPALTMRYIIKY